MPAGRLSENRNWIRNIYGFYIGIDEYSAGIPELRGCVRDARFLQDAFAAPNQVLMINQDATRKNILGQVQWYLSNLKTRDLLIFTMSGHGVIVNNDFAIAPVDVEAGNLLGTVLPTYYLMNALSEITKNGGRVLVIIDTCHAGAINFDIGKYIGILSGSGMSCLISSGPRELSYEATFDSPDGQIQQGVFTKHLIDGLRGAADVDHLNFITLRDLYDYIYTNVTGAYNQHPVLIGTLEGSTILKTLR